MKLKLVVAEKPSVGMALSQVLGASQRRDGYLEGGGYIVSWCIGHLVALADAADYDPKYAKWDAADLPITPDPWKYTVPDNRKKQFDILRALLHRTDVDTIINGCDAGREGEHIFRLAYEQGGCNKPVKRLWISSMEETAIRAGFDNLRPGAEYDRLYQSALCRARADWLVGINMSRLFSLLYRQSLNVGRVQSPTLALITQREAEIQGFVKEPFYTPEMDLGGFRASGEKMKDKTSAEHIRAACDGKTAVVSSVQRSEKDAAPPKLYDLTTLQREANRVFGYTAQQALDYAQALYEKKLITYPRTDSRYLTEDMAESTTALVMSVAASLPFVIGTPPVNIAQVVDNGKVNDHHAIIPTPSMPKADLAALPEGERNILHMLAVRLICATGEKHLFTETVVTLDCEGYIFTAKGKTVLSEGWKAADAAFRAFLQVKPTEGSAEDVALPEITEGQAFPSVSVTVREGFTSPKKRYSEDTLLQGMETAGVEDLPDDAERRGAKPCEHGLGTPATRAGIIEKLIKSGLVERKKKSLVPTEKGVTLVTVLPDGIKSPALTAQWEGKLKEVEAGTLSPDAFLSGIVEFTALIVRENSAPNPEHSALFPPSDTKGKIVGNCPRCGQPVREWKKGFSCDNRDCVFKLWKDNKFFSGKKKTLDEKTAAALLSEGRVFLSGLFSEKTGKSYNAAVILDDTGGKYVNFKLEFEQKKDGGEK